MDMVGVWIAGGYIAVMAVIDRKTKEIPVIPSVVCFVFIVLAQIIAQKSWLEWVPGILIGIFIYCVSIISRGAIGKGDALAYLVTGVSFGFTKNLELFMLSLFISAIAGAFLVVICHVGKKHELPFMPFTALAFGMVVML